jgi:hypothetical protein
MDLLTLIIVIGERGLIIKLSKYLFYFSLSFIILAMVSCGAEDEDEGENLNALFKGTYRMHTIEDEAATYSKEVRYFDGVADGKGTATATLGSETVVMHYQISEDRTMSLGPDTPGAFEISYGIIKSDGSILAVTDAFRGEISGEDIELSVLVKKSSMVGTSGVPGTFIVGRVGFDSTGNFYVSREEVTIDGGAATGSWEILAHSDPAIIIGTDGSLTLDFSDDGTFTYDDGTDVYQGIISPDCNIFVLADYTEEDADDVFIAVGVRKSTGGAPNAIGNYVINQIGLHDPTNNPEVYTSRVNLTTGISTFDFQVTASSLGSPLASGSDIDYSISSDGTVDFPGNAGWAGIASPDGEVMVLVDSDTTTANEIHLGLAIKQ